MFTAVHETTRDQDRSAEVSATMKAVVHPAYGSPDVLRFEDAPVPAVKDDEVLIRVRAASVCKGDVHLMTGKPYPVRLAFGFSRPKHRVAGQNVAGTVVTLGKGVRSVKRGDAVYGVTHGAFAEYAVLRASALAPKPERLSFEQAAALPVSGVTALRGLRDAGKLTAGQSVLINGAAGGVGSFAVQIAKSMGAEVTAVCGTKNVERMRALGADHVVDYEKEDFVALGARFDVMFDLVGNRSIADVRAVLRPKGTFVACAGAPGGDLIGPFVWLFKVMIAGVFGSQRMVPLMVVPEEKDLLALNELVDRGAVTPALDRSFPLADAKEALRHVATGRGRGTTVITF